MRRLLQKFVFLLRWLTHDRISRSKKVTPDPVWAAEVQAGLSFLFSEHGATLINSSYRHDSFGLQIAVIQVGRLLLRVTRDASLPPQYIESRIAPVHAPNDFRGVQTACMALEIDQAVPPAPDYKEFGTLPGLANSLRETLPRLNEAFSEPNYPVMKDKMERVEREGWKRWEQGRVAKT